MANSRSSAERYEYATVNDESDAASDSDPLTTGYWTNPVNIQDLYRMRREVKQIYFSIRDAEGTGTMTVTLQFICPGETVWTDYDTYTTVTRLLIEGPAAGVWWRAGVKVGDWTSGELVFGFDW